MPRRKAADLRTRKRTNHGRLPYRSKAMMQCLTATPDDYFWLEMMDMMERNRNEVLSMSRTMRSNMNLNRASSIQIRDSSSNICGKCVKALSSQCEVSENENRRPALKVVHRLANTNIKPFVDYTTKVLHYNKDFDVHQTIDSDLSEATLEAMAPSTSKKSKKRKISRPKFRTAQHKANLMMSNEASKPNETAIKNSVCKSQSSEQKATKAKKKNLRITLENCKHHHATAKLNSENVNAAAEELKEANEKSTSETVDTLNASNQSKQQLEEKRSQQSNSSGHTMEMTRISITEIPDEDSEYDDENNNEDNANDN